MDRGSRGAAAFARTSRRPGRRRAAAIWIAALAGGLLSGCDSHQDTHQPHSADAVGLDCSGAVLRTVDLFTAEECAQECREDGRCHAWSFDRRGQQCKLREYCEAFDWPKSQVQAGWRPYAPEQLLCPRPEQDEGLSCPGNDIAVIPDKTFQGCCDACHATVGCLVFTLRANGSNSGDCHLKSRCPQRSYTHSSEYQTGWMQRPGNAAYGNSTPFYQVGRGWFNVTGYHCGDHYPATAIWYPIGAGPFGVVIMRPGMGGELDKMDDWLETAASLGMIVISPFTAHGNCGGPPPKDRSWADILRILEVLLQDGLQCNGCEVLPGAIDFDRVAFMGHSMGAKAATQAAYKVRDESVFSYAANVTVRAVIASHDAYGVEDMPPDVALMVTGGEWDNCMHCPNLTQTFERAASRRKIGACGRHTYHMEPVANEKLGHGGGGTRENWWSAQFLACHVGPAETREHYCDKIHGNSSSSMAQMHDWKVFLSEDSRASLDADAARNGHIAPDETRDLMV